MNKGFTPRVNPIKLNSSLLPYYFYLSLPLLKFLTFLTVRVNPLCARRVITRVNPRYQVLNKEGQGGRGAIYLWAGPSLPV